MLKTLIAAALIVAAPAVATDHPATPIEAAERAFAADGLTYGIRGSFLRHMADDAIMFAPGPVSARALYGERPATSEPKLEWWPQHVAIARSGDLGLSVGPAQVNGKRSGYYSTIWRKGAGGEWKWIYDGGAEADALSAPGPDFPAGKVPVAPAGSRSQAVGLAEAQAAEAALVVQAAIDAPAAYRAALSADAWLLGPRDAKDLAASDIAGRLTVRPTAMTLKPLGGGASAAGDFVWTYGEAAWTGKDATAFKAHYMHVWQRRAEGWRLIFETLNQDA